MFPWSPTVWIASGIAVISMFAAVGLFSYQKGRESRQPEIDRLRLQALTLTAANETASAEALRRQQEAAQAAKAIEDEQRRRIEETEALVASYNALAELGAADYSKRLRNAAARACRQNPVRGPSMSEATAGDIERASAFGLLSIDLADDLGALARRADAINSQFAICYAAVRSGREVSR